MATANKTSKTTKTTKSAKTASAKKASAKATATETKSTATKSTGAKSTATKSTSKTADDFAAQAKEAFGQANDQMEATMEQVADRVEAVMTDVVRFSKKAGFTTVGMPFALQSKYEAGTLADLPTYKSFLDDAKVAGEEQVAEFQKAVEPYVKQVADRVEPVVSKWEDSLPEAARKPVKQSRERVSRVVNA